jgi:glycosyltransferase involved in cell wall biosynthesis
MGVALDLVITGRTGYRAKIKDISDLAHGIYSILSLDSNSYNILSQNCTQLALNLYSPKIQIDKIENILIDSQNR